MAKKTSGKKQAKSTQPAVVGQAPTPREAALDKALALSRLLDSNYYQQALDAVNKKNQKQFIQVCKDAGAEVHGEWLYETLKSAPGGGGTTTW